MRVPRLGDPGLSGDGRPPLPTAASLPNAHLLGILYLLLGAKGCPPSTLGPLPLPPPATAGLRLLDPRPRLVSAPAPRTPPPTPPQRRPGRFPDPRGPPSPAHPRLPGRVPPAPPHSATRAAAPAPPAAILCRLPPPSASAPPPGPATLKAQASTPPVPLGKTRPTPTLLL